MRSVMLSTALPSRSRRRLVADLGRGRNAAPLLAGVKAGGDVGAGVMSQAADRGAGEQRAHLGLDKPGVAFTKRLGPAFHVVARRFTSRQSQCVAGACAASRASSHNGCEADQRQRRGGHGYVGGERGCCRGHMRNREGRERENREERKTEKKRRERERERREERENERERERVCVCVCVCVERGVEREWRKIEEREKDHRESPTPHFSDVLVGNPSDFYPQRTVR